MKRIIFIFLIFASIVACDPEPSPPLPTIPDATATTTTAPSTTTSTVAQPQTNGKHLVWGDSLAWQALGYTGCTECSVDGREWRVWPGKSLRDVGVGILYDLGMQPDVLTLALGTNDAGTWGGRDGWNSLDEQAWTDVINRRGNTKIVIILPWIELGNDTTMVDIGSVERAREWLSALPGVTTVDWAQYTTPGVLDPGGIHVSAGNEGLRYTVTVAEDPL